MKSFSGLVHSASGLPKGQWQLAACDGVCATCSVEIKEGVPTKDLVSSTFSRQSEFLRFGDHVCEACGWLYSYPKETHRNVIAAGESVWWPMISAESATPERPQWLDVLKIIAGMPADTPIAGVLTADPKPRLWPLSNLARRDSFGIYVHCLDWDVSDYLSLNLDVLLSVALRLSSLLERGFSKSDCKFGLLRSKITKKHPAETLQYEAEIKNLRNLPEFIPALLVAHK